MKQYQEVNGTSYHIETPNEVISILERCRQQRIRIVLDYGENGKSWGEVFDIRGYVGRSTGVVKVPLLVYNSRSYGGGHILDHRIIQIKESRGGRILYLCANYQPYQG